MSLKDRILEVLHHQTLSDVALAEKLNANVNTVRRARGELCKKTLVEQKGVGTDGRALWCLRSKNVEKDNRLVITTAPKSAPPTTRPVGSYSTYTF